MQFVIIDAGKVTLLKCFGLLLLSES